MSMNFEVRIGFGGGGNVVLVGVVAPGVVGLTIGVRGLGVGVFALAPDCTILSCSGLS